MLIQFLSVDELTSHFSHPHIPSKTLMPFLIQFKFVYMVSILLLNRFDSLNKAGGILFFPFNTGFNFYFFNSFTTGRRFFTFIPLFRKVNLWFILPSRIFLFLLFSLFKVFQLLRTVDFGFSVIINKILAIFFDAFQMRVISVFYHILRSPL